MKRKLLIQGGIAMAVLLVLSFGLGVGQALATTGCFLDTIGHPWETYICWMSDNGITSGTTPTTYSPNNNVTRGQMAVFMQRQAEIPPSTGNIYINAGLGDWTTNGGGAQYVENFSNITYLRAPGAGTYGFQITPDLPATFYGRQLYVHSVKLCYAASANAFLTDVFFRHYSGGAVPVLYNQITDATDRADTTCREYIFPFNGSLWGSDHVNLYIEVTFAGAASTFNVGSTTFTLVPSAGSGVLSPTNADETRPVIQAPQPANGEAGTAP